jgi:hypothetical protein
MVPLAVARREPLQRFAWFEQWLAADHSQTLDPRCGLRCRKSPSGGTPVVP